MRRHRVPTMVVHSEKDGVVPFVNADDMAERADAALYRVPGAHHSWMLANPRQAADMMRQLLDAELGRALRSAADHERINDAADAWQERCCAPTHHFANTLNPRSSGEKSPVRSIWSGCAAVLRRPAATRRRRLGRFGRRWARPVLPVPTRAAG